jgi:hypothetical protein
VVVRDVYGTVARHGALFGQRQKLADVLHAKTEIACVTDEFWVVTMRAKIDSDPSHE